jgi:cell division cycle 14
MRRSHIIPKHLAYSNPRIPPLTITDRLYLASYVETPDANTLFPYPDPPPRSPSKRSQRALESPAPAYKQPFYFTVDDTLLYNAFHHDFGPLHIGHLYRFALQFHEILGAKENKDRPIVFWSRADPRSMWSHFGLKLLAGIY